MRRGFTLLELSIVLTLIAVILGGGLATFTASLQAKEFNITVARMDAIDKALLNFSVAYGRIPCPSDNTKTVSSTTYGIEAVSPSAYPGTCYGGTPAANYAPSSGNTQLPVEGGIPTRALKLTDDYMYDGWGRKFSYAVDPTYTISGSLPPPAACAPPSTTTGFSVTDASGVAGARTTGGIYALISHGANGHGAYTSAGVMLNAGSTNANELTNCHCTSAGVTNSYAAPGYVAMAPTIDSSSTTDNFDDIVTFKEAWQMQAPNAQTVPSACNFIYVLDSQNARIEEFNSSTGTYMSQFAISGGGNNNQSLAMDVSGNFYTQSWNSNALFKYSHTGNLLITFGAGFNGVAGTQYQPYTGNGQLDGPWGIAVDGGGNVWTSEIYNNRVQEYNSAGAWLRSIGGPSPYTCETTPAGSPPACASGNGNGQFNDPQGGVVIDAAGSVWVADRSNNRVQKFNGSGVYQTFIGTYGTGNGQMINPTALALDGSGNLWVSDSANNRIEEFSSSGTFLASLGGTSSACSACMCTAPSTCPNRYGHSDSGNGQLNGPGGIAFDSKGNIWVSDTFNNRVQEFSSSGTYLMSIGAGYNGVSGSVAASGAGNGQFYQPEGIIAVSR